MPVTTRQTTRLAIRSEPEPSYHPLNYLKFFSTDAPLHEHMYGKDFDYDFKNWPRDFWFKPKHDTTNFRDVITKLRLASIVPPSLHTHKTACIDLGVRVLGVNGSRYTNLSFEFFRCELNYDKPHDVEDVIVKAIERKLHNLPALLQSFETRRITKIHVRNPPPQLQFQATPAVW
jgi:hypothetical protein